MKRLLVPAVLAATALGVVIVTATGSAESSKGRTFTVIERDSEGSFQPIDIPPRAHKPPFEGGRLSAGDGFALHQALRSPKGRRLGSLDAICSTSRGAKGFAKAQFVCHGGYTFKHGTIDLEALFKPGRGVKIGITGGTGTFSGASGHVSSASKKGRTVDTIHLGR